MKDDMVEAKSLLRQIAISETNSEYLKNVAVLKKSLIWNKEKSKNFRDWIEKTWLPLYQVLLPKIIITLSDNNDYSDFCT